LKRTIFVRDDAMELMTNIGSLLVIYGMIGGVLAAWNYLGEPEGE
jgi:hypothetical protein